MWRHGDVLIATIPALPSGAQKRGSLVLAYGEVTGHSHRIEMPGSAEVWEIDGMLYVNVMAESARVVHEEHKPISLPRGFYRVWQQREYTPQEIRRIVD